MRDSQGRVVGAYVTGGSAPADAPMEATCRIEPGAGWFTQAFADDMVGKRFEFIDCGPRLDGGLVHAATLTEDGGIELQVALDR